MSDPLPERCCGRCRHSSPAFSSGTVLCYVPSPEHAPLPSSLIVVRYQMSQTAGERCPAFEAKETETK